MVNTIDLRKDAQESGNDPNSSAKGVFYEWSAYEFEKRSPDIKKLLILGGVALLLIIFGIVSKSYFFSVLVVLSCTVFLMYVRKSPNLISFAITREGIWAGRKLHPFSEIKSFYIFENVEPRELSLETSKIMSPFVRMPLGHANPEDIREIMTGFVAEIEHKDLILDQIARIIGF